MKRRILLVDDDMSVLLTLKAVLELHHYEVETASSGGEACAKLARGEYEIVVTDVRMETEDAGFEVVRSARRQSYGPVTAILTAYPLSEQVCRQEQVQSLLVKPIGTMELVRQLEALLVKKRSASQGHVQ
jgi:CheY-like chemotaxis protein